MSTPVRVDQWENIKINEGIFENQVDGNIIQNFKII